jgi:hypothetical protein
MNKGVTGNLMAWLGLVAVTLMMAGCQAPFLAQTETPAAEPPPPETPIRPEGELMTFPREITLTCPEPEPSETIPCPAIPKIKCPACPTHLDGKIMVGEVEQVKVTPPGIVYTARIDTGATGTSIHATDIVRFERDGERWVRFNIDNPDGDPITLEREVLHRVRVKQAELDGFERRLVVLLKLTMGSVSQNVEVSLADRSEMEYPLLVGRDLLRDNAVVDVGQQLIAK